MAAAHDKQALHHVGSCCRLSPHVHVVEGMTTRPAEPLPEDLAAICDGAGSEGFLFVVRPCCCLLDLQPSGLLMHEHLLKHDAEVMWDVQAAGLHVHI